MTKMVASMANEKMDNVLESANKDTANDMGIIVKQIVLIIFIVDIRPFYNCC